MHRTKDFWRSLGRRGALRIRHYSVISMQEAEFLHPGSAFRSIVDHANWLDELNISRVAKRLTRLRGRHFIAAVQRILVAQSWIILL